MKILKLFVLALIILGISSCETKKKGVVKEVIQRVLETPRTTLPIDQGFSEYITAYTSGIVPANGIIEVRFTPEFAARAKKQSPAGLFTFNPLIKGKTEWTDETTLVFRPSKLLDPGKSYRGELNLSRIGEVKERLKIFPLNFHTLKKDFRINTGILESSDDGTTYNLVGEIVTSDFINKQEVESYLEARLNRKNMNIEWDHQDDLIHKFSVAGITRTDKAQEMILKWDGTKSGVPQKNSVVINIPPAGEFRVLDVKIRKGESQSMDVIFSDPVDVSQDLEGLIYLEPSVSTGKSVRSNIVTLIPSASLQEEVTLYVEASVKNRKGTDLETAYSARLDFTAINPGIQLTGDGIILPSSQNLIFPFRAVNLKAVDLKIIKIFENNLPYFLQENDINSGYYVKRFGRPVYAGRIDLTSGTGPGAGSWNLHTINLADYINVEPGVLYKVQLSMRKSYSLSGCELTQEEKRYEELLQQALEQSSTSWDDSDNYYDDDESSIYYSAGFRWEDRDDPCKEAYYSPDKNVSRNILASNIGLIAKRGEDNILHVIANDLITALPASEVTIEVYDYQMQHLISGSTKENGTISLLCNRKPFLLIAKKDKDRNYLKINDGSALSMSSFDVSGTTAEKGIKAFIYGERDVWRPGDSIYLSVFIKDMKKEMPPEHPVQFELINPLEQRVDNQIQKHKGNSLLVFCTRTAPDAVTGNYRAEVKIGGATFTKRIRIETLKPNRLKINLTFPGEILGGESTGSTGSLNVKWLNGSIASNLSTSVEYLLKHTKTEFEKYSQYDFDDPASQFYSETVNIFDDKVDGSGKAAIKFSPRRELNAPGMLNAVFTAKVQEQGGDESIAQFTYKYAPYPVFVGINLPGLKGKNRILFTDTENEVRVVTLDEKGRLLNSQVEMTVYKLSYRWWWESDEEDLAYYIANQIYKPVIRKTVMTRNGEGSFTFRIDKNEWGRYLVRASVPSGHATGKMLLVDWPWEYGMKNNAEGATLLAISTDKEKYNPGDEVKLSFPTPENSRAIVSLENATGVLDKIMAPATKGNTEVRFRVTPEMAPNVYAYVTVIQPHSQTVNDMPVRLYGVVPVMVEDPGTRLTPQVQVASEIRSQRPFEIKVSEANKKPMTYTLAVVDEGLLDITGFRTPDPWNYFYAREALGVQTWDLYDYVLGAFGGTLERVLAVGGDEALVDRAATKAQRFIPVVKFLGPFTLQQGKTKTHTVILPQYTGSVRVMVIAGSDKAFGAADKSVLVRDPLMVLVTAPRVISPGEKAALPVTVFVQKDGIRDLTLKVEGNDLISFDKTSMNITTTGTGETDSEFSFTAGDKTGTATIKVTATGGGETAVYDMQLEIRNPNPPEIRSELKILSAGEKWESSFESFGIEGSNSARIEVSSLPSVNLEKHLDYLLSYPHGCTEQITSTAFPQLWLTEISGKKTGATEESAVNIKEAISKLLSRQMSNGGLALWPGSYQPDNWVTSYAGHFLLEAERKGYIISSGFIQKWTSYQKRTAREWRFDNRHKYSCNDQAYRLFTLALAGQPDKGAMNRLRETDNIPRLARWLLAAAFAQTGRPEVAADLLDVRNTDTEKEYNNYFYGSPLRDKAIVLYTLSLLKNKEESLLLARELCNELNKEGWYSTQSLAWGLLSYMKWVEMQPEDSGDAAKVVITYNGEKDEHTIAAKELWTKDLKMTGGNNTLSVVNNSGKTVYATLLRKGVPLLSDAAYEEKGLGMKIDYLTMDLNRFDNRNITQGTDFMMVVKVSNNTYSRVENIALTQMVPSGWEIRNMRLFESITGIKESEYDYRDIRDDRVNTYFSLNTGETKTFILILNAAYKGEFFQPSIWAEAMYTENCYARIPGAKVKVTGL
ncbi:MAG TPA: MG2 domain-containing protein [Bacteroidales bacterium]|jgi:uncharacterized protein YfaS (alpha-2-macroglobulin family)|nr:MAG: hypothetical protein BWX96_02004 [Bacteroidetes bacterium ADurb.Bin145]HOU02338.1 MG2 domain-containing protein [Bacteroidales bacterium]HQG62353.1 MG2 domain-containing protein [Bacteroidales bacterium]HQK67063.1 MG2 domain-containing protein [Bacteroidales bacterium]